MAVASLGVIGSPARAAVTAVKAAASALPDVLPTDRDSVLELLSRLADADVRELLRRQLEHGIAGHQTEPGSRSRRAGLVVGSDAALGLVRDRLGDMLSAWPRLPSIVTSVQDWLSAGLVGLAAAGSDCLRDDDTRRGVLFRMACLSPAGQPCSGTARHPFIRIIRLACRGT